MDKTCTKCGQTKEATDFYKHAEGKDGLRPSCIRCCLDYAKINKVRVNANNRASQKRHREKIKAWHARNYLENKERITKRVYQWRTANKERFSAANSVWKRQNLDKIRAYNHTRRATKAAAGGSHTSEEIKALLEAQGHRCANPFCNADLHAEIKHLDHVIALSRGGSNGIENLQWLCAPCNLRKANFELADWLERETQRAAA